MTKDDELMNVVNKVVQLQGTAGIFMSYVMFCSTQNTTQSKLTSNTRKQMSAL